LLQPDGKLIIAVPPVVDDLSRQSNIDNPYHLNIWTPHQWFYLLNLYFSEVQPYRHGIHDSDVKLDFSNTPADTQVTEKDFLFSPISIDEFYRQHTLTVIFVAQKPRSKNDLPDKEKLAKFVDDSFTRPFPGNSTHQKSPQQISKPRQNSFKGLLHRLVSKVRSHSK
jgi:hypothetical protein